MVIELFKYNEDAYNSTFSMLNTNVKYSIVFPTGTGKSFIGFKLYKNFLEKYKVLNTTF